VWLTFPSTSIVASVALVLGEPMGEPSPMTTPMTTPKPNRRLRGKTANAWSAAKRARTDNFDGDDIPDTVYSRKTWEALQALQIEFERKELVLVMLDDPLIPMDWEEDPQPLDRDGILARSHILLPESVGCQMHVMAGDLIEASKGQKPNQYGPKLWEGQIRPAMERIKTWIEEKDWHVAFGELLGMALFLSRDDAWVGRLPNASPLIDTFEEFFYDLSVSWLAVLRKSDADLGLNVQGGLTEGYRKTVVQLLRHWQIDVNDLLSMYDDKTRTPRFFVIELLEKYKADGEAHAAQEPEEIGDDSSCEIDDEASDEEQVVDLTEQRLDPITRAVLEGGFDAAEMINRASASG